MKSLPSDERDGDRPVDGRYLFEARSYSEWGRRVIRLRGADPEVTVLFDSTVNEPTAELMDVVRDAFSLQVSSRYVSVFADGNPYAVQALARRYGFAPEQIVTTTGATSAFQLVLKALIQPGDEVLVERPGFDLHPRLIAEAGGVAVSVDRPAPGYRISLAEVEGKLTPRTRVMVITNLHNPSGAYLSPPEIEALAQRLAAAGCVLIVDEIYADFADDTVAAGRLGPNVVTISSLTKVYGLFALKFGWVAAHADLIEQIRARVPDGDTGVSKLAHAVAAHVLEAPEPFELHWKRTLNATRPLVVRAAEAMQRAGLVEGEVPPFGCMYFPRIVGVTDTLTLARRLFDEHGVLVAPGEYFGAPGHLRIGFGSRDAGVEPALQRLAAGLAALR